MLVTRLAYKYFDLVGRHQLRFQSKEKSNLKKIVKTLFLIEGKIVAILVPLLVHLFSVSVGFVVK